MDKENINEYEKQRLENIRKNQEKLKELNLLSASLFFKDLTEKEKPKKKRKYNKRFTSEVKPTFKRITRNQAKQLNIDIEDKEVEKYDEEDEKFSETEDHLMSAEEYFSDETRKEAIIVDGHFEGWINPVLIEKYHFEKSAKEAWENNGGGKYSRKNPLGEYKETVKTVKPRNWSSAKFVASKLFQKNPNAYFYRHLEPGLTQNFGDWDENEKELFLKIAKKYGCGDKWGIFSSYIPRRVGYQCANYYRQVIIPEGLIIDPNYKFSKWGKAIYCGNLNNNRKKKDNKKLSTDVQKQNFDNKMNSTSIKKDKNEESSTISEKVNSNKKSLTNKQKNNTNNNNEKVDNDLSKNSKNDTDKNRKNSTKTTNKKMDDKVSNSMILKSNNNESSIKDNAKNKYKKTEREIIEIFDDSETENTYSSSYKNNTKKNKTYPIKHMILRSESSTGYSLRKRKRITYVV